MPEDEVYECAGCGGETPVVEAVWLPRSEFRRGDPGAARPYCCKECFRQSRRRKCPPHDFGLDDDPPATLKQAIRRTCPHCGVTGAEILGKMIASHKEAPDA